jgi:hypothetical protein
MHGLLQDTPINTEGLKKTTNVLCEHCNEGRGCRIYETRPSVCRNFYCEWRLNPRIPATWRPEKSGVFVERVLRDQIQDIPQGYGSDYAVLFIANAEENCVRDAIEQVIGRNRRYCRICLRGPTTRRRADAETVRRTGRQGV